MIRFLENHHVVPAFLPVADAFAGGTTTKAVSLENDRIATLLVFTGAIEDANISNLVTLEACTSAAGANNTAMAFKYSVQQFSTTVDTWAALTDATSSGYNFAINNAVPKAVWLAEVTNAQVAAAVSDGVFVRAVIAETADKTITAGGVRNSWLIRQIGVYA